MHWRDLSVWFISMMKTLWTQSITADCGHEWNYVMDTAPLRMTLNPVEESVFFAKSWGNVVWRSSRQNNVCVCVAQHEKRTKGEFLFLALLKWGNSRLVRRKARKEAGNWAVGQLGAGLVQNPQNSVLKENDSRLGANIQTTRITKCLPHSSWTCYFKDAVNNPPRIITGTMKNTVFSADRGWRAQKIKQHLLCLRFSRSWWMPLFNGRSHSFFLESCPAGKIVLTGEINLERQITGETSQSGMNISGYDIVRFGRLCFRFMEFIGLIFTIVGLGMIISLHKSVG